MLERRKRLDASRVPLSAIPEDNAATPPAPTSAPPPAAPSASMSAAVDGTPATDSDGRGSPALGAGSWAGPVAG
eukprot:6733332-Prymnesium_polylepis.1